MWSSSLTRGGPLLGNSWYFGKLMSEERCWLTRGACNRRFDCNVLNYQDVCLAFEKLYFVQCKDLCPGKLQCQWLN